MSIVTDEQLMAFADGALPAAEAHALEIMLAEDPALEARLKPFLVTGAPLAAVFDAPLTAPIPDRLIAAIASAPRAPRPATAIAAAASGESVKDRLWNALFGGGYRTATAAFATLLVVSSVAGWTTLQMHEAIDVAAITPGIVAWGPLKSALDTAVSSNETHPGTVTAVMTLAGKDGRSVCRQYRMDGGASGWFGGLACRDTDGQWRIAAHVKAPSPATSGGYVSAGSDELAEVERATNALTKGDALDADAEKTLIARGWTLPAP